jgi:hypothetical protein
VAWVEGESSIDVISFWALQKDLPMAGIVGLCRWPDVGLENVARQESDNFSGRKAKEKRLDMEKE